MVWILNFRVYPLSVKNEKRQHPSNIVKNGDDSLEQVLQESYDALLLSEESLGLDGFDQDDDDHASKTDQEDLEDDEDEGTEDRV